MSRGKRSRKYRYRKVVEETQLYEDGNTREDRRRLKRAHALYTYVYHMRVKIKTGDRQLFMVDLDEFENTLEHQKNEP